jgi:RNA polymerase sigma-70 factor (ECF subfamily)
MAVSARPLSAIAESELLRRAQDRDPDAVRSILQQHNQRLYRIARSILRDDSEAEDVLQEAYCRAFSRLGSFRGEARLGTWLARIVINEALGRRRRAQSTLELSDAAETSALPLRSSRFPMPAFSPTLKPMRPSARSGCCWSARSTRCPRCFAQSSLPASSKG